MNESLLTTKLENINEIKLDMGNIENAFGEVLKVFKPDEIGAEIAALEEKTAQQNFWNDKENSTKTMRRLTELRPRLTLFREIKDIHENIAVAYELIQAENDASLMADLVESMKTISGKISEFELSLLLDEKYDPNPAIISIHPGAGGVESQDWAQMLMRMYVRWMEQRKFKYVVIDQQAGEEAGIKSATIMVNGPFAYGYLKSEKGVHRLVRISPFDANHRRHTSFASVDVLPQLEDDSEIVIDEKDLKIDTYRSSGAGGQHVNVTDSAVRITHLPTNTIVQCQNERSQWSNKAVAMKILKSKLAELQAQKRQEEIDRINGVKREIAWGSQIRSYVFHPYNLIKDHRTSYETGNVTPVMDGYIDEFVKKYLQFLKAK